MPDARERSPLFYAVKRGDVIRVRQLLQSGVNPDDPAECRDGRTPLTVAAARGNTVLLRLLLDYGAKADAQALVAAAFENHAEAGDASHLLRKSGSARRKNACSA